MSATSSSAAEPGTIAASIFVSVTMAALSRSFSPELSQSLEQAYTRLNSQSLRTLFAQHPERFAEFSVQAPYVFVDYSKTHIDRAAHASLLDMANERALQAAISQLFNGHAVNSTERRAALHTALRAGSDAAPLQLEGEDVRAHVKSLLAQMQRCVQALRNGDWRGVSGLPITQVVNLGIGGSDLGPQMVCDALTPHWDGKIRTHFVGNVDAHELLAVLAQCHPEQTLFIVASKTFTTQETMSNAALAREWLLARLSQYPAAQVIAQHFVANTTNLSAATAFGIQADHIFSFRDWVGGRYSLWSSIGLPIALQYGWENFMALHAGARAMDQHFASVPFAQNAPVLLALLDVWYRNYFETASRTIAPYYQYLRRFPAHLQQLEMESNGKGMSIDGEPITWPTSPVIWGEPGTNGQHAYFQMLHQGTDLIPADFILIKHASHDQPAAHRKLLANGLAQAHALMQGKTRDEAETELRAAGLPETEVQRLANHKIFPGDRPSVTLVLEHLDATHLGALVALYEHRVYAASIIWQINAFDQWGVELGKVLAKHTEQALLGECNTPTAPVATVSFDSSTQGLINLLR